MPRHEANVLNLIKPDQVVVYVHANYNDVWLYNETHDPANLFLLSKDAFTIGRDWPDYASKDGVLYRRDQQFSTPQHLDHSSYFGMRKYVRTGRVPNPKSVLIVS